LLVGRSAMRLWRGWIFRSLTLPWRPPGSARQSNGSPFAERSLDGRTGQDEIDTRNEISQETG
jgi:hypothetical protein